MEAIISVRNLVNRFGSQIVHDDLSMDIQRDEILASWVARVPVNRY